MSSEDVFDFNADKVDGQIAELLDSFEAHPLMQPPDTHPTLFFLFDFIRNTRKELKSIDPEKVRAGDVESRMKITEVMGRNVFTNDLINDTSGKLALLTGGDPSRPVEFGQDIRDKARVLMEI